MHKTYAQSRHWPVGIKGAIATVLLGGLAGLGQAPFGLWPLTLAAFALFLRLGGPGFKPFWAFGLGYFLITLFWIVEPFFVDMAATGWMAPFALFFMCGGMALFWGVAGWLAKRLSAGPLVGVLLVVLAEAARGHLFTGFPWVYLGAIWIDTPLAQLGAYIGPLGLTLLTALAVWALGRKAGAAILLVLGLFGWFALPSEGPQAEADAPLVRLVQPNIAQRDKWTPETIAQMPEMLRNMSVSAGPADLVVWPETATPWLLDEAEGFMSDVANEVGGHVMIGGLRFGEGLNLFNSLGLYSAAGIEGIYDKSHLVPFGEYVPFAGLFQRFGIRGLAANEGGSFASGPGGGRMEIEGIGLTLPLICYEGIFAHEVNASGPRARFITLVTNDGWFGNISGPYQHFNEARWRAIEQGLPVVRVGNTGISAMIDARGQVVASLGLNEHGVIDAALPPALPVTLYARLGDFPFWAVLFTLLFGVALRRRVKPD